MKYNVHLYPEIRIKICDIEAESHEHAAKIAIDKTDLYKIFSNIDGYETEPADDIRYALIDVVGDEDYVQSKWIDYYDENFVSCVNCGLVAKKESMKPTYTTDAIGNLTYECTLCNPVK